MRYTRRAGAFAAVLAVALCATAAASACPGGHHGDMKASFKFDHGHHHGFKNMHGRHAFVFRTTLTSPDSGTCGNNWANDTLKRVYKVKRNGDGTYTLVAFDRGTFTTVAGQSPGACETTDTNHGATVTAGITGGVTGFVAETISGGTLNTSATCAAVCDRNAFVAAFFGASATQTVTKFAYFYGSRDPGLIKHVWVNAGTGTTSSNHGDIATA